MAELSPFLGFLIIFKDSFKLISKNVKFMAAITTLSLLLPSILLLVFCYVYQTLTNFIMQTPEADQSSTHLSTIAYLYLSLLLLFEITCIITYAKLSTISGIATILVSATSYTDTKISPQDLCSKVKAASTRSKLFGYRSSSSRGIGILVMAVWILVISMAIFHPNPITIAVTVVVGISMFGFFLYDSVPTLLSHVVSVVEEKFEGSEAVERAEELVEGQRHHGLIFSVVVNLLVLSIFVGFWLVLCRGLWINIMEIGLFVVNFLSLVKIYVSVAYTVFYYRCKKYHGDEEVGVVGNFGYSKLPASNLGGGVA